MVTMSSKFAQQIRTQPKPAICKKGWERRADSSWPRRLLVQVQLLDWMPSPGNPTWIDVFSLYALEGPPNYRFAGRDESLWANLQAFYAANSDRKTWNFNLFAFGPGHAERTYSYSHAAAAVADCQFGPIQIDSGEPFFALATISISY
jgi:hypothetical protein